MRVCLHVFTRLALFALDCHGRRVFYPTAPSDSVGRVSEIADGSLNGSGNSTTPRCPALRERARQKGALLTGIGLSDAEDSAQEFTRLTPENTVYKLIGPVLIQQDQSEARSNVDKRLDFIRGDMYVYSLRVHTRG